MLRVLVPLAGLVIETVGGVFALETVIVTEADVVNPPMSVTLAKMVWVPAVSWEETVAPVPIWPVRLELQTILLLIFPS